MQSLEVGLDIENLVETPGPDTREFSQQAPIDDAPAHQGYLNDTARNQSARRTRWGATCRLELLDLLRSLSELWSLRHWVATVILAMPTGRPGLTASVLKVSLSSGAATSEIWTWVPSSTAFEPSAFSGFRVLPSSLNR